jgi:CO dehydrogenase/acetyl-CoA synthase alpha subunit
MKPMAKLLEFGGSLSLCPVDPPVQHARDRYEQAATIRDMRKLLGCDDRGWSCIRCRQGCSHEGQTMVLTEAGEK